jgi:predicted porin
METRKMKQTLLAAALMAVGASASAQSSVTLYGRMDNGIEYQTNSRNATDTASAGSRFRVESGDWGTSLWGLRGVEDIGGGSRVVFNLEDGLNTVNGQSGGAVGTDFSRYADVGIANNDYGTLLLGKQQWIANQVWDFDPLGQSNWSSASLVGGRNWPGSQNDVSYQTPTYAGFNAYGVYSLSDSTDFNGNTTVGTQNGRRDGLSITYTSTIVQVRGIYDEIRSSTGGFNDVYASSREYFAGVNVFLGPFKLQAAYQGSHAPQAAGIAAAPSTTNLEWGGVTYTFNPAIAVTAAAYHVNANDDGGAATMYTLAGTYNFSKRTLLALEAATVRNSAGGSFGLNANEPGTGDSPLQGHSQSGVYLDLQHAF